MRAIKTEPRNWMNSPPKRIMNDSEAFRKNSGTARGHPIFLDAINVAPASWGQYRAPVLFQTPFINRPGFSGDTQIQPLCE